MLMFVFFFCGANERPRKILISIIISNSLRESKADSGGKGKWFFHSVVVEKYKIFCPIRDYFDWIRLSTEFWNLDRSLWWKFLIFPFPPSLLTLITSPPLQESKWKATGVAFKLFQATDTYVLLMVFARFERDNELNNNVPGGSVTSLWARIYR